MTCLHPVGIDLYCVFVCVCVCVCVLSTDCSYSRNTPIDDYFITAAALPTLLTLLYSLVKTVSRWLEL